MIRKMALIPVAALIATIGALAVPGVALADGVGTLCSVPDAPSLCVSMNGTVGDQVYGKLPASDAEETMIVAGYSGCEHNGSPSEYVQYIGFHNDTTDCPFTDPGLDAEFEGYEIVTIYRSSGNVYMAASGSHLYQESPGSSGEEFIQAPTSTSGVNTYVSVLTSDANQGAYYLCPQSTDFPLYLTHYLNSLNCYWALS